MRNSIGPFTEIQHISRRIPEKMVREDDENNERLSLASESQEAPQKIIICDTIKSKETGKD